MNTTQKKHDVLSWILGILLMVFGLFFVFHLFSFTEISHRMFAKRVQKAVYQEDDALQQSKQLLATAFDQRSENYDFHSMDLVLPPSVCAYVFKNDSLVYWNNTLIEPKVLRKRVGESCDTIMNLSVGDFLITTTTHGPYAFYLYSLLNTTYPIENKYFTNRFQPLIGKHKLNFVATSPEAFPIYSRNNKLLSHFTIEYPEFGHSSNLPLLVACGILTILCLYLLVVRRVVVRRQKKEGKQKEGDPRKEVPKKRPFIVAVLAFLAVVVVVCFGFGQLFRYGFSQGFLIPGAMRMDYCFLALVLSCLVLVTLALGLRRIIGAWIQRRNETLLMITQLVFWGIVLTLVYNLEYNRYENRQIRALAQELSQERDTLFEQSYQHFLDEIQTDTTFNHMIFSDDMMEDVMQDYMHTFLFDSVMSQYNVSVTLCIPNQELVVQPYDFVTDCQSYFQEKIKLNHGVSLGDSLWWLDDNTLDPGYQSTLTLSSGDSLVGTVFLEFSKPVTPTGFGLPKILWDDHNALLTKTSVASYRDSLLVYKFGSYVFPNYLVDYKHPINTFSHSPRMRHYVYRADEHKVLAITFARRGWKEKTTPFVVFFGLLLLLYLLIYFVGRKTVRSSFQPLSYRFQVLVLVALGVSFLIIGPVTVLYLRDFYEQKADEVHFERIRTLTLNLTSEMDFAFMKQPGFKTALDKILRRYSETFFTDINVYGVNGKLMATTTPELLDMHLQSSWMNAKAFHSMQGEKLLYHIQSERMGDAVYQSSYIAIQDYAGHTLAYLNTPFFSSQSDLKLEILNYVLTYINFILLISFIFLAIVLFITRRITDPLVRLQDKMSQVDITKTNEKLEWKSHDEIGKLINQYNQLVVELEKSAAELRRTAAESAWRGVARQVAHEIKNSLTPMRLSVQLLQRSVEQQGGEMDERIQRTSRTLLEQIDALSDIASSFSQYAKLPVNNPQPFDLSELVGNLVNLYDNVDNIAFNYEVQPEIDYIFNGDKTNLNSAIGNIIKNATQAVGLKSDGRINVRLHATETAFVVSVKDNGRGIKEEDKKMIFLPNFTTKAGGSGVGLSLAYNIIQSAGGFITFESQEGEGTEFVVELPRNAK
jgi:signal transduction histidine kinase